MKIIYKIIFQSGIILLLLIQFSCKEPEIIEEPVDIPSFVNLSESVYYEVDLKDRSNDNFKVTMFVGGLTADNNIFQMPVVVPGTYRISDFGRFVTSIKGYDKNFNPVELTKLSSSRWTIENPEALYRIEYSINETWDFPVNENSIYKMGGSSFEDNHALINTFAVLGYIEGLKDQEIILHLNKNDSWITGTALPQLSEGYYIANDYDFFADSPILTGTLSTDVINSGNSEVSIYTFSDQGIIKSSDIKDELTSVITDASAFLKGLPVDHYEFLYHFEGPSSSGALEHSYSSVHVMREAVISEGYSAQIKGIAAHEFFHIVTPLNIHSEIIEDFDFINPNASEHLWLYEGVTEWASDFMQYRNGSMSFDELAGEFRKKILANESFDLTFSLSDISLQSYSDAGRSQFGNIYNRGSMNATLMDIRLLELSNGNYGLRELILELVSKYGPNNAFPESNFFDIIVEMTYPEMRQYIDDYIKGTSLLPYEEYFLKIGVSYNSVTKEFMLIDNPSSSQAFLFSQWSKNL